MISVELLNQLKEQECMSSSAGARVVVLEFLEKNYQNAYTIQDLFYNLRNTRLNYGKLGKAQISGALQELLSTSRVNKKGIFYYYKGDSQ